jgi:hypothetical protein
MPRRLQHDRDECDEGCSGCPTCYRVTGEWFCNRLCAHAPHCRTCGEPYDDGESEANHPDIYCSVACESQATWEDERNEAYERAAARARLDDFERTGGKDWT